MPIDDLWYLKRLDPATGKPMRSSRHGRGKRWRVRWEDPETAEVKTLAFERKPDAVREDNKIQADIIRGQYIDPSAGRQTVAEYAEEWRKQRITSTGTEESLERYIRLHVVPVMGGKPMLAVRSGTIKDWIQNRLHHADRPLAPATIHNIYHLVLRPMFEQAITDRVIGRTPCTGITLPKLPKGTYVVPTGDVVMRIVNSMPAEYRAAVLLAAGCGWRTAEVLGLEVDGVDFLRRVVHVRHQLREWQTGLPSLAPPKSATSTRKTELPVIVGEALAWHIQNFVNAEPITLPDRTIPSRPKQRTARLLFLDHRGLPMRRGRWSQIWRAACKKADVPSGVYTMRSLRHFFATTLIYAGKNVKTVQLACGHATPTVTLNTYLGYWPDNEEDSTRSLLDKALAVPTPRAAGKSLV